MCSLSHTCTYTQTHMHTQMQTQTQTHMHGHIPAHIYTQFDWFDIEKDGTLSVPFQVSLFGTDGRQITSHIFKDVRLFYHWGNVAQNGRYIRVDVLEKEKGMCWL